MISLNNTIPYSERIENIIRELKDDIRIYGQICDEYHAMGKEWEAKAYLCRARDAEALLNIAYGNAATRREQIRE